MPTGFGITGKGIKIIEKLSPADTNLVFMHHHLYHNHSKFLPNLANQKLSSENDARWKSEIVTLLKQQNVQMVVSGDPTCCAKRQTPDGARDTRLINDIFLMKNIAGIIHANAASTWNARHGIHWLDLEVEGNEVLARFKVLTPDNY